ncbi:RIP-like protein [Drosophila nasuta]|uniref:RIP-like protein n=1 Tax=Drosophila nasuta TaxID=42062 RepID=UPI00295F4548|nr:RIP-like protein [Drosophila nasuta]
MQCPNEPIHKTSVEQKRHAQNVAKNQRLGMPKLRDLLREKCRIRIVNARKGNVDGNRQIQLADLDNILRLELNELDQDLEMEQHIYEELLADVNEWYALQEQNLEELFAENERDPSQVPIICPVCLKKPLLHISSLYKCECGVQFEHAADIIQLQQLIQSRINEHEVSCTQALLFFIEAQPKSSLFAICGSCDYCCSV